MGFTDTFTLVNYTTQTQFPTPIFKFNEQPFKIILKEDQNFEFFSISGVISHVNGFTSGKAEIFINNILVGDFFWPGNPLGFEPEPWFINQLIPLGVLKRNVDNIIRIEVEQGILGGDTWTVNLDASYELNTIDPPEIPPILGDPTEGTEEPCKPFDIGCLLFGNVNKSFTTIFILAAGIIAVVGLTQINKLFGRR